MQPPFVYPPFPSASEGRARPGPVLWLTGLSGSGKTTLARALERELLVLGRAGCVLDGDEIRRSLNRDLGFSPKDREENIRRVAEVAALLSAAGLIAISAFISPYRADRRRAREIVRATGGEFIEIFVDAPLAVCEARDVKGLYRRARAGELPDFTGIGAPYERPLRAEVTVRTDRETVEESRGVVLEYLRQRLPAGTPATRSAPRV